MTAKDEYENVLKKQVKKTREFVFRGKPKNEAEYEVLRELYEDDCENGFIYGSLVVDYNKYYICVMAIQVRSGIDKYITTIIEVFPETVGEYTGLKDKNDKMIFEGDIVKNKWCFIKGNSIVRFGEYKSCDSSNDYQCGHLGFYLEHINDFNKRVFRKDIMYFANKCEIIGNVFDNPELLRSETE